MQVCMNLKSIVWELTLKNLQIGDRDVGKEHLLDGAGLRS
jgi:hypothetical protein